jgi:hypothetical protein
VSHSKISSPICHLGRLKDSHRAHLIEVRGCFLQPGRLIVPARYQADGQGSGPRSASNRGGFPPFMRTILIGEPRRRALELTQVADVARVFGLYDLNVLFLAIEQNRQHKPALID